MKNVQSTRRFVNGELTNESGQIGEVEVGEGERVEGS